MSSAKDTSREGLPFRAKDALEILFRFSNGRVPFVAPADITRSRAIQIEGHIKAHPDRADWETAGAWLRAGGMSWLSDIGASWIASDAFRDVFPQSRAWAQSGRPRINPGARAAYQPPVPDAPYFKSKPPVTPDSIFHPDHPSRKNQP